MPGLNGKKFSPVRNSEGGRVSSDAIFHFEQTGPAFKATYSGSGFSDGHLIGKMTGEMTGHLIYHSRSDEGHLEAGEANAVFAKTETGRLSITMNWRWLNGTQLSGISYYEEI